MPASLNILASPSEACEGCARCCMQIISPPYELEELAQLEFNAPAAYRDFELAKARRDAIIMAGKSHEIPCWFLDEKTRRCRHYDHRPQVCREFAVGNWKCEWVVRDPTVAMVHYSWFGNKLRRAPAAPLIAAVVLIAMCLLLWR